MSANSQKIFIDALSLPSQARAEIAHRLLTSLEGDNSMDVVSDAWRNEIKPRLQDFDIGKAKEVPAEEALRRAEAAIG